MAILIFSKKMLVKITLSQNTVEAEISNLVKGVYYLIAYGKSGEIFKERDTTM
jgi:hypothetical protein